MTSVKTIALIAALGGGSAVAVTVATGHARVTPRPADRGAAVELAAGQRVELPQAVASSTLAVGGPAAAASAAKSAGAPASAEAPACQPSPECAGGECGDEAGNCKGQVVVDNDAEAPRITVDTSGAASLGPADARVTIVEFADFECPFCVKAMSSIHELRSIYPKDVRVVFMNYPLPGHIHAQVAAEAALAADAQGKFWEMHDLLLANQEGLGRPALESYAKAAGLDVERFKRDLDSHRFAARITQDRKIADGFGLTGTPTFLFNGRLVQGARDIELFKGVVEEELARAGK